MRTRWNSGPTGRGRTYLRRASTALAGSGILAAVLGRVPPAPAAGWASLKHRSDWIGQAGRTAPDRDDSQLPAPERPKHIRPAQRVLTTASSMTAADSAATLTTNAITAGATSLKGES